MHVVLLVSEILSSYATSLNRYVGFVKMCKFCKNVDVAGFSMLTAFVNANASCVKCVVILSVSALM